MKENDAIPTIISIPTTTATYITGTSTANTTKRESSTSLLVARSGYKFWVLAAILLLAVWSMFTGSVTLKWSTGNLSRLSKDPDFPIYDDLDILEVEDREKVVRHMWDVYTQSKSSRLPRFWQEAFEAAYEALSSDVADVRNAAVSEIAKMSIRFVNPDPLPIGSNTDDSGKRKNSEHAAGS